MAKSIIQEMSFVFAVQIVRFCRDLQVHHKEFVLSRCEDIVKVLNSITLTTRQNLKHAARSSSIHSYNSKLLAPHSKLASRGSP
jgi:hypothetical protein